jgi:hypothetical protein
MELKEDITGYIKDNDKLSIITISLPSICPEYLPH